MRCRRAIKVGDDTVTDADKRDYTMTMDVREMMRRSSNVGFVLVGRRSSVPMILPLMWTSSGYRP